MISDVPGYRVGDDGSVWSSKERSASHKGKHGALFLLTDNWKKLSGYEHKKTGYIYISLQNNNKQILRTAHKIVLEAFIGLRPEGMQCCHWDGDRTNNNLCNLRWDTPKSNSDDKVRHGTMVKGEYHPLATISQETIETVRSLKLISGIGVVEIAGFTGIRHASVSRILRNIHRK